MRFRQYIAFLFGLILVLGLGFMLPIAVTPKVLQNMAFLDNFDQFSTTLSCRNLLYRSTEPLKRNGPRLIRYSGPRLYPLRRQPTARARPLRLRYRLSLHSACSTTEVRGEGGVSPVPFKCYPCKRTEGGNQLSSTIYLNRSCIL